MIREIRSKKHTNIDTSRVTKKTLFTEEIEPRYPQYVRNGTIMFTGNALRRVRNVDEPTLGKVHKDKGSPAAKTSMGEEIDMLQGIGCLDVVKRPHK